MNMRVWLHKKTLAEMEQWGDKHFPEEVGGTLLGYEADVGDVVVREIIGPGPSAMHYSTRFVPDAVYQQVQLEKRFAASGGSNTYLGDWHTHPNGTSELSSTDKRTLRRIADRRYDCTDTPTMIILSDGLRSEWRIVAHRITGSVWRPWGRKPIIETLSVELFE
ncbi:MAG TPA: Mov34/MPN/PAD-1 family protein [Rhodothermales bacterium]|nr:Mov34/MPN/PAD-1 family protein [Rhodothermales bacterium]